MFFGGYYDGIRISDGMNSEWFNAGEQKITARHRDGSIVTFGVSGGKLAERKHTKDGRVLEWLKWGAYWKGVTQFNSKKIKAPITLRFRPGTGTSLHGLSERWEQKLFGQPGKCRTMYSGGRFLWQDFRYRNGKLAYKFHHCDKSVTIKNPAGKVMGIVNCPGGFSTRSGAGRSNEDTHTCKQGEVYFNIERSRDYNGMFESHEIDYSKDGNCSFTFYNKKGRLRKKGEYKNRQKVGEWVIGGKHVYFINGLMVGKKLWDTPPEKLKVKTVLKIKNAQMRAALIGRIGYERFARECKSKVIHEDKKRGNRLLEFPVKVDDGNGDEKGSNMRILQVLCPSTKHFYYLNVPDFVWDGGDKTPLDTCEKARQWTFGVDDPRKKIKFAVEA